MLWPFQAQAANKARTLQYHPDGRDIVCVNGENRYTRALYGGYSDFRVETSDRPPSACERTDRYAGKHSPVRSPLSGWDAHLSVG